MRHREKFTPEVGKEYRLPYGGVFRCIRKAFDGTIDWDYSTGGHFAG